MMPQEEELVSIPQVQLALLLFAALLASAGMVLAITGFAESLPPVASIYSPATYPQQTARMDKIAAEPAASLRASSAD